MLLRDQLGFSLAVVRAHKTRSWLTATGIGVGIAAVVLLTSLGTGVQRYVLQEFTQFGTNLVTVVPGVTTTLGMSGAVVNTVRPLSIDDAEALRRVPNVEAVSPLVMGNAAIEAGRRTRRSTVYGVSPDMPTVWSYEVGAGRFLPEDDPNAARAFAVLGATLKTELFGTASPLGELVRIGGDRYRVVGVMREKGQFLGFDLDDAIYIPASRALAVFDRESLMEIDVTLVADASQDRAVEAFRRVLMARHGDEDFTIIPQEQMLEVLGSVLSVLTFGVAALGSISLLVGGVGILTIMVIAIRERTGEIGLLRALGATRRQVLSLFLLEAAALSGAGGLLGLVAGLAVAGLLALAVPAMPVQPTPWIALVAEAVAILIGLVAGTAPALRAARLDPVEALRAE